MPFYQNTFQQIYAADCNELNFPAHLHNAVECLYVASGQIEIMIDNTCFSISQGEIAVVFPHMIHSYISNPNEKNQYQLFIYPVKINSQIYHLIQDKIPVNPILEREKIHSDIPKQLSEIIKLCQANQHSVLIESLVQLVLVRLLEQLNLENYKNDMNENIIGKAIIYITENFKNNLTLTNVAKHLNISKYHLSRSLKNVLNTGFCSYINSLRIDYAKSLLTSTNLFVSEIATESGYDSLRSFNRCFVEQVKCSPKEYRKKMKE